MSSLQDNAHDVYQQIHRANPRKTTHYHHHHQGSENEIREARPQASPTPLRPHRSAPPLESNSSRYRFRKLRNAVPRESGKYRARFAPRAAPGFGGFSARPVIPYYGATLVFSRY